MSLLMSTLSHSSLLFDFNLEPIDDLLELPQALLSFDDGLYCSPTDDDWSSPSVTSVGFCGLKHLAWAPSKINDQLVARMKQPVDLPRESFAELSVRAYGRPHATASPSYHSSCSVLFDSNTNEGLFSSRPDFNTYQEEVASALDVIRRPRSSGHAQH